MFDIVDMLKHIVGYDCVYSYPTPLQIQYQFIHITADNMGDWQS